MADNKQNTNPNVPNLRFPEFKEVWKDSNIGKCFDLYSGNTPSRMEKEHFIGDVNWITSGELKEHYIGDTKERISEKAAADNNLRILPVGTFVMAIYGLEAEGVRGTCSIIVKTSTISQACMAFTPKSNVSNEFLYSWYKKHGNKIGIRYAQGTKQQNLSYDIIEKFPIRYPSIEEQEKLNTFISLLDSRIATQNKIIQQLQSLIKGIRENLFSFDNYSIKYLGELCSITTGKLDANAMVENGKYPFFTCAEDTFRIDEYAFDTEALLISGNGANLGYIHYYNGKFNAYQRTYVLDKFAIDVMYIKYYLETFLNKRINQEVNVGNTPYIVLSTLTKMKIKIPDISQQRNIINVLSNLNLKLNQEKDILSAYQTQKAYLLRNLFI